LKHLIVISGPTAVGKTSVSVALAKHYNCEILSADSRQFFKELNIGTAKPTYEEMDGVTHHFIGNRSISEDYTAGKFEYDALKVLDAIFKKHDVAILVGGSGLYIDALCNGLDDVPCDKKLRDELTTTFEKTGITFLQKELQENDIDYFNIVDKNNPHRLIRGVEVFRLTGKPYSSFLQKKKLVRYFKCINITLEMERELLYKRINLRVDKMVNEGLETEVRSLIMFKGKTALKTVGYQEFFDYFDKKTTKDKAIELIKRNSRRYAKRQISWLKRNKNAVWMNSTNFSHIINHINSCLNSIN